MPIGAFASAAGLSLKALRLYDHLGILRPAHIDADSGYRYYRAEQLRAARLIRLMRLMDMPLALIDEAILADPPAMHTLVTQHLESLEARVEQARSTTRSLLYFIRDAHNEENKMTCPVEIKETPPQLIVSISRRVRIDGLLPHIVGSLSGLQKFVWEQNGELAGAPFGIYHGPVNANDDGPMEVCWPVQGKFAPAGEIVVKELPGGKTACVEVKGEQCRFPAILEAYDTGADWVRRSGHELAGPPREIWLDDKGEHMLIAWPFADVSQNGG